MLIDIPSKIPCEINTQYIYADRKSRVWHMKNNMIWWIGLAVTHNIIFNWMIHFHLAFWHAFKCFQESFDGFENLKKKMIKSLCSIFFWQAWSGKLYRTNETNPFNVEYMQKKRMIIFYTISILCSCHYVIWYFSPFLFWI